MNLLKFLDSKKTTKFCEISTVDLSYVVTVKSTMESLQNFVAFSECMNFIELDFEITLIVEFTPHMVKKTPAPWTFSSEACCFHQGFFMKKNASNFAF